MSALQEWILLALPFFGIAPTDLSSPVATISFSKFPATYLPL